MYLSFDRVFGSAVANDGTQFTTTGTLTGGALVTAGGIVGNAMLLNSDSAVLTFSGAAMTLSGQWSLTAWFKGLRNLTTVRTLFRGAGAFHPAIINAGSDRLGAFDAVALSFRDSAYSVAALVPGTWNHIAVVGSPSAVTFYVNGVAAGTVAGFGSSSSDLASVGNFQGGGQPFALYVDEVYYYPTALTATQVLL